MNTTAEKFGYPDSHLKSFDKIDSLLLIMVDPDANFCIPPRYSEARKYAGLPFVDDSWPGLPDMTAANDFPDTVRARLIQDLKARFS